MDQIVPQKTAPALSVIIPANNEAPLIGDCLEAVVASHWDGAPVQVILVANGCTDDTVAISQAYEAEFEGRGWALTVLDLPAGGKLAALNTGDEIVQSDIRIYLDADVIVAPELIGQIHAVLDNDSPRYASGTLNMTAQSWASRAYVRIYRQVPFMAKGVPGCGIFAVNAAGRARWGVFPQIISDDTYVRLQFSPDERIAVPADYKWPVVEGFRNLVKVRRRQDEGVREVAALFPELMKNEGKGSLSIFQKLQMAAKDPVGFGVYSAVAIIGRLTKSFNAGWDRGR